MKAQRGEVVLLDYPFSDSSGRKVRPALVVQSDDYNAKLTSTIVALITKNLTRVGHEPSQFLIDIATADGRQSGLTMNSGVTCSNLYTVNERHVLKVIGRLGGSAMQQIDGCLKAALGLS